MATVITNFLLRIVKSFFSSRTADLTNESANDTTPTPGFHLLPEQSHARELSVTDNARSRLFALIIGVNEYRGVSKLRGAVADAMAVKDFLESELMVPRDQIKTLLDQSASRKNIIQEFESLKYRPDIRRDDHILIFFAGHGTEITAPSSWVQGQHQRIQAIIPEDFDGKSIHPIPDRTIGALIGDISREKGDNVTVIFDCCYSGSGTRQESGAYLPRSVQLEMDYQIPKTLDDRILQPRGAKQTGQGQLSTHVLLAACGATETAMEYNGQGLFTTALLDLFKTTSVNNLTYTEVLDRLKPIKHQNPQCEGINKDRVVFGGKVLSPLVRCYRVDQRDQTYFLQAGSASGIAEGAEFAFYPDRASIAHSSPLVSMMVTSVLPFESILSPQAYGITLQLPPHVVALQTKVGLIQEPRLYLPSDSRLQPVFDVLESMRRDPSQVHFALMEDSNAADFGVHIMDSEQSPMLAFDVFDTRVRKHGLRQLQAHVPADYDNASRVLTMAARFYYHLNHSKPQSAIEEKVTIEFRDLQYGRRAFDDTILGDNLLRDGLITIVLDESQENICYGFRIVNRTNYNLYPCIFYFDNSDLSIAYYYGTGSSALFKVDSPLPAGEELTLGYGSGGADAFTFNIPEGQELDVGFFKVIFSTTSVDSSHIAQPSPFNMDKDTAVSQERAVLKKKPDTHKHDIWGIILIPIVIKRKSL